MIDRWRFDRDGITATSEELKTICTGFDEPIQAVAVRHPSGTIYTMPRPARHGNILNWMNLFGELPKDYSSSCLCGFIASGLGFVTRHDAFILAENAKQLLPIDNKWDRKIRYNARALYSEDVW